jgi:hypothetical protein
VGQAFFLKAASSSTWNINFSACSGSTISIPPVLSGGLLANGDFSFNITGLAGSYWNVYQSADLTTWTQVAGVTLNANGQAIFTDNNVSGVPYRFYHLSNGSSCSQAIGFTRVTVAAGAAQLIANQFDTPANTLAGLFSPMIDGTYLPDGTQLQKWNGSAYTTATWSGTTLSWSPDGSASLAPGEGAFIQNPSASPITVTFAGLVREGQLTTSVPAATPQIVSVAIPKAGAFGTVVGTAHANDTVQIWNGTSFTGYSYVPFGGGHWNPSEPVLGVGQAFFLKAASSSTWNINFSACP